MKIRPSKSSDVPSLAKVAEASELFPGEMLPEMIGDYLSGGDSHDVWLTCELEGEIAGFCFAVPEAMTDGTWNMLAIAVDPAHRGKGAGSALVKHLEADLLAQGQRVLIADTSGIEEFKNTRKFYSKNGYNEEARIRDFWSPGNDKVTYWKLLV